MALITTTEVINLALPNKNLDGTLLLDSIALAEIKYIKKALGWRYFDQIVAEQSAGLYTGMNETLLNNYIKPCLARYTVYEALPMVKAEITSNGLLNTKTDFTSPAGDVDMATLRNKFLSDAELLLFEMRQYIWHHAASFPLYVFVEEVSGKSLPYLY